MSPYGFSQQYILMILMPLMISLMMLTRSSINLYDASLYTIIHFIHCVEHHICVMVIIRTQYETSLQNVHPKPYMLHTFPGSVLLSLTYWFHTGVQVWKKGYLLSGFGYFLAVQDLPGFIIIMFLLIKCHLNEEKCP